MSRRNRRQPKNTPSSEQLQRLIAAEVERRLSLNQPLPPGAQPRPVNQDALMQAMTAQQAPAKQGTPMFAPGAPLMPQPGMTLPDGPRQFAYPVGYNIYSRPRSTEVTSFETLRNLAMLYDGIQLCEQVWLDTVSKLSLVIKPRPEITAEQQSASDSKYADKIRRYTDFFSYPDQDNGYDLKSWLRAAVRDQLQLDALAIYVRRNRGGGIYSLELVAGENIKPLITSRGRRPMPPYPAYEQFVYGVPAQWFTADEMLYLRETTRTESIYGLSRVERIILRVNQALRKQNKDLTRFTDGNIPPAILQPPDDGSQWTPEHLATYQMMWDALLAGNDQARSRIKVIEPGSTFTSIDEDDIFVDFDRFLLNVTCACFSMTMADLGFTENVNRSSGESQENVFYRRAVQPLMDRYAQLFTFVLRHYFGEQDLIVSWSGFEESEDFNAMAASYVSLVGSGIVSPTTAAHKLNLPWSGPEIPNYIVTKDGPVFLEDVADPGMRKAANDAKMAGLQFSQANPGGPPKPSNDNEPPDNDASSKKAAKGNGKQRPPRQSGENNNDQKDDTERSVLPELIRAGKAWRPPSKTQLDLETQLAKAIKGYATQAKLSKDRIELPDGTVSEAFVYVITDILEAAVHEGRRIATGTEERGLISVAKNLAGKAVQIIGTIVAQIQAKAAEVIGAISDGKGVAEVEATIEEAETKLADWASNYAEVVAITEIHAAVEEAVLDEAQKAGVTQVYWAIDPDACPICQANAEASPLPIGRAFPSGDTAPPAHPRCRCTVAVE